MSPPEIAPGVVEHPEFDAGPTAHQELDSREVTRRALGGFRTILVRSLGQRGLQMVGNILLARWLAPKTFGLYAIVSFIVGMAGFFSDLGLTASLVQRKGALTEEDLRTGFTLTLVLNMVVVGAMVLLAGPLVRLYDNDGNVGAVQVMAATVLLSTFTVIPVVRLERALRFERLSFADLAAQFAYVGIAVPLAMRYWHRPGLAAEEATTAVWVFVFATVGSKLVHLILVNIESPWMPRLSWDLQRMRALLAFGLPFQLNGIVNVLKDNFVPTFVAFVTSPEDVGYLVWSIGLATNALFLIPLVSKVAFPAFSRLQHDLPALKSSIESSIRWTAATVFPATFILAALARQIVEHVYGPKWLPGLPSFYLLCLPMLNAAYSTVMVSALYGMGQAKTVLRLTITWAIAGWALGVPLTLIFGMEGFAGALCLVSCLSWMTVREMNKIVKVNFVVPLLRIGVLAAFPAALIAAYARYIVHDAYSLLGTAVAGGLGYLLLMFIAGELHEVGALLKRRARTAPPVIGNEGPQHA